MNPNEKEEVAILLPFLLVKVSLAGMKYCIASSQLHRHRYNITWLNSEFFLI
jgi:hypothetical protein